MSRTWRTILTLTVLAAVGSHAWPAEEPQPAVVELPEELDRQQRLAAELSGLIGHEFRVHVTPHFIIAYDTDEPFARQRGALLEKTHGLYYKAFAKFDPPPKPLDRRLVCVLFKDFDDYARYAEETDGASMTWAGGYYSSRSNRIAFFHDKTSPRFEETTDTIDQLKDQIKEANRELEKARAARDLAATRDARDRLDTLLKKHRWLNNRMGVNATAGNDAKTTHEALHQLAYNSGLQARGVEYPFWLTEGLATSFEADDANKPFGPYHDNLTRRKLLTDAHLHGRLKPLAEFAAITDLPEDLSYEDAVDLYSHAWGLFQFLYRRKHTELEDYMQALATLRPGERDAQTMRKEFEDAFGPLPKLERDFNAWLRSRR